MKPFFCILLIMLIGSRNCFAEFHSSYKASSYVYAPWMVETTVRQLSMPLDECLGMVCGMYKIKQGKSKTGSDWSKSAVDLVKLQDAIFWHLQNILTIPLPPSKRSTI